MLEDMTSPSWGYMHEMEQESLELDLYVQGILVNYQII